MTKSTLEIPFSVDNHNQHFIHNVLLFIINIVPLALIGWCFCARRLKQSSEGLRPNKSSSSCHLGMV